MDAVAVGVRVVAAVRQVAMMPDVVNDMVMLVMDLGEGRGDDEGSKG